MIKHDKGAYSLTWGGGTHFDVPNNIGKFGFGLPNSSINQTTLVEVYTRTRAEMPWHRVHLDINQLDELGEVTVPEGEEAELPEFVAAYLDRNGIELESGSVVVWVRSDRLTYNQASTLKEHLLDDFGVTYRYMLPRYEADPETKRQKMLAPGKVRLAVKEKSVEPIDPLFLTPGPQIALIQGNLDQRLRNDSAVSEEAAQRMGRHFRDLSDLAAVYRPDLIVWPETSWPYEWQEKEAEGDSPIARRNQTMAEDMAARWHSNLLVGMNSSVIAADGKQKRRYNSAILIDRQGNAAGRYDKIHRVPFGEYVPFRDWLPWINYFAPYDFDYSVWPGEQFTRFPLVDSTTGRRFTLGALICYEDTDAVVARPYGGGDGAAPADFLLNISNDGWFDGTSEHDEHLAICRFRAIECRRSVARSVNMGISAIIDSNGRVLQPHELPRPDPRIDPDFHVWTAPMQRNETTELPVSHWHEYKKIAGVLLATLPIDDRVSLYSRWGDWLLRSCWFIVAGALVLTWIRRASSKPAI